MILFIQPFGVGALGGGPRILRALLENAPHPWLSVAALTDKPPAIPFGREIHIRQRPSFGRLDHSRFHNLCNWTEGPFLRSFTKKIIKLAKAEGATAIHVIPQGGYDGVAALQASRTLGLPLHVSVHDDLDYTAKGKPCLQQYRRAFGEIWNTAVRRTVISREMGEAMSLRWGRQPYEIITDGIDVPAAASLPTISGELTVYFAGLFHLCYEDNLRALQLALLEIQKRTPGIKVRLKLRCGLLRPEIINPELSVEVLPFAKESVVHEEMAASSVLYFPLGFDEKQRLMNLYSLSTKMISYLGSGVPILYHGPDYAAAGQLLRREKAAFLCNSNETDALADCLARLTSTERTVVVGKALDVAREQFVLSEIRRRFWAGF